MQTKTFEPSLRESIGTLRRSWTDDAKWLEKARLLAPVLAKRASQVEIARRLPEATLEDFREAGFHRLLVPRVYGGEQRHFSDLADVVIELAGGCTSSAWVLSLFALHGWLTSLFPEPAQQEVFSKPDSFIASPAGSGRAEPTHNGFRLYGQWTWASGVRHSDWLIVNAVVGVGHQSKSYCFLVPTKEAAIIGCWQASGMCGTGSERIAIHDIFVPNYRSIEAAAILVGEAPGTAIHADSLYRVPAVAAHCLVAASSAIGTAISAIHYYMDRIQGLRAQSPCEEPEAPIARVRLARTWIRMDAVRLLHCQALATLDSPDASPPEGLYWRAWARAVAAHTVAECREVTRDVLDSCGSSVHLVDSPLQRMARDVTVLSGHVLFEMDCAAELFGRIATGLQPQTPLF